MWDDNHLSQRKKKSYDTRHSKVFLIGEDFYDEIILTADELLFLFLLSFIRKNPSVSEDKKYS